MSNWLLTYPGLFAVAVTTGILSIRLSKWWDKRRNR